MLRVFKIQENDSRLTARELKEFEIEALFRSFEERKKSRVLRSRQQSMETLEHPDGQADVPRARPLWRMMLCVPFVRMKCIKHRRLCSHAPTVTMTSTITAWPCGWRPRGRMSSVLCAGHPGRPPPRTRPLRGQSPANISTTPPPLTSLQLSNRGRVSVMYKITTTSPPTPSPHPPATPRSPGPLTLST